MPLALLLVLHTCNNTDSNKVMIFLRIALYYGDACLVYYEKLLVMLLVRGLPGVIFTHICIISSSKCRCTCIHNVHQHNFLFCVQDGETFLHLALNHGDFRIFTFLLGSLADVDVNAQDKVVQCSDYGIVDLPCRANMVCTRGWMFFSNSRHWWIMFFFAKRVR